MPGNYKKLQERITFDAVMQAVSEEFAKVSDHRRANARYKLSDVLGSAFAMFSLKSPSLLCFDEQTKVESRNLKSIYHLEQVPSDTQMRSALDPVDPALLRQLFQTLFGILQTAGVLRDYHFWRDHLPVTIDGVEHFAVRKIHCPHCSQRTLRDGAIEYFHSGLGAVVVNPAREEVFPLDFAPIRTQEGEKKNDCARNAAKRLCAALHQSYPDLKMILVEDALYANAPHLRQITGYGWHYILNVKPDSHQSLERQFAGRRATDQVKELRQVEPSGVQHYFAWASRRRSATARWMSTSTTCFTSRRTSEAKSRIGPGSPTCRSPRGRSRW